MENFINLVAIRLWIQTRTCTSRELEIFSGLERGQPFQLENQRWTEGNWKTEAVLSPDLRAWTSWLHYSPLHSTLRFGPFHFPLHAPGSFLPLFRDGTFLLNSTPSSVELSPHAAPPLFRSLIYPLNTNATHGPVPKLPKRLEEDFENIFWKVIEGCETILTRTMDRASGGETRANGDASLSRAWFSWRSLGLFREWEGLQMDEPRIGERFESIVSFGI